MQKLINVLIVDDSPLARELLAHVLAGDPQLHVIGNAGNGAGALEAVARLKPDVVTMDIEMPGVDGFEATRRIMAAHPVPIVIISAHLQPGAVEKTFQAMQAGAVAVLEKPRGMGHPDFDELAGKIVQTVKVMSEVRVVRRWTSSSSTAPAGSATAASAPAASAQPEPARVTPKSTATPAVAPSPGVRLVAIGASTGGPPVLQAILSRLSPGFPAPILIVQHIAAGFGLGLVEWLERSTARTVRVPTHGEIPIAGRTYLAPDGMHMGMDREGRIILSRAAPEGNLRPAVSFLFRTVAAAMDTNALAAGVAGVLLTGMGRDGAEELKLLKDKGAVTIAQDKESALIHGMPGEAIKLGGATYVLPPERIAALLESLARRGL